MPKQRIFLILGVVFAFMAVFASKFYLDQQREEIFKEAKQRMAKIKADQVVVLVAKNNIAPGTALTANSVSYEIVSSKERNPNSYNGAIDGMVVISPIAKGEQISGSKIIPPGRQSAGLAESTPPGKRAITISVDNTASLVGMIKPGNGVDVLFIADIPKNNNEKTPAKDQTNILPLFQNVSVLAVGQDIGTNLAGQKASRDASLITLALAPNEAGMLAFAMEQGKIRLVLRSPKDSQIAVTETVNWDVLFKYLMPERVETKKPVAAEVVEPPGIEIYRGARKEKIPLSK